MNTSKHCISSHISKAEHTHRKGQDLTQIQVSSILKEYNVNARTSGTIQNKHVLIFSQIISFSSATLLVPMTTPLKMIYFPYTYAYFHTKPIHQSLHYLALPSKQPASTTLQLCAVAQVTSLFIFSHLILRSTKLHSTERIKINTNTDPHSTRYSHICSLHSENQMF